MTWNNYQTWLENKVVEKATSGDYILTDEATIKYLGASYSEDQENELNEIVNNLMLSLQATIEDDDSVYHLLPTYDSKKNWEGQIPTDIKLGKDNLLNTSKISPKVYTILARMFNEWQSSQEKEEELTEEEKQEKLGKELEETLNDNPLEKEIDKLAGYALLTNLAPKVRKEILVKWEAWLNNYEQLTEERKQSYQQDKEKVSSIVEMLKNSVPEKATTPAGNWLTNLPWNNIALYGGGVVIILFAWNWLKSQTKG